MQSDIPWQVCNLGSKLFLIPMLLAWLAQMIGPEDKTDEGYSFNF